MPKITIDGIECQFEGKKMIVQVAREHGIAIPHYCYHPGLSVVASCRICLAEVFAPNPKNENKIEPWPPGPGGKLSPTCQSPALDGMVVQTKTPKAAANQKAVMEYLLINHPLDCPVCDQAGECSLQDYSYQFGRGQSRFEEEKIKNPKKDVGPHVYLYSDRCIMCSRCVRFTREVSGTSELAVFGRGNREEIDVFPGRPLANELSGNVVDICPVGALLDKDFLFTQRVWFLKHVPSIDGVTASGDNIWIDQNEGRIYRLKPRVNLAVNKWWISDEVRYSWKFVHSDERLKQPRRQQVGGAVECDWARAYSDARDGLTRVAQAGPGSLSLLLSPMLPSEEAYLLAKLVRGLDAQAVIGIGPIPISGEDKTFPGGYTIYAEKCPNSRGVRRAAELIAPGQVLDFAAFVAALADKKTKIAGAVVSGNYPSHWPSKDLVAALKKKFLLTLDILPHELTEAADVLLPTVSWAEKAGSFENAKNVLQAFAQGIAPLEMCKNEGQIALDLAALCGVGPRAIYDAAAVRQQMGGVFVEQMQQPRGEAYLEPEMEYVEL